MAASPAVGVAAAAEAATTASDSAVKSRKRSPRRRIGPLSFRAGELHRLAEEPPIQPRATCVVTQSTPAEPAHGDRVDAVFLGLHSRRQARLVVVRRHGNARLDDRRTAVELFGHKMHRRAVLGLMCVEYAPVR